MDIAALTISMLSMGGLGALFSIGLAVADKKLHVDEDPRISLVNESLPGANCGGCGLPGCGAFAEAVVNGKAAIGGCPVNTEDGVAELAEIMGVEAVKEERKVARVLCIGGVDESARKGDYLGIKTCIAGQLNKGGEKLCEHGCMGYGDCETSCPFDAIHINNNGLPEVIDEKCTGCGNCAVACPRDIIEIHPESNNLFIWCKSLDEAKYARTVCIKSCVACGACVKGVDSGQMEMVNNLPIINYDSYGKVEELPTEKCPNQSILMVDEYKKLYTGKAGLKNGK